MATREEIIAKIQKLRSLATSDNLNEAANAAAAAEKLIQEHQLSEAQIDVNLNLEEEPMSESSDPVHVFQGKNVIRWQASLIGTLASAYNVSGYFGWKDGKSAYRAVGRPSDVATLSYQFAYFVVEITRLRHKLGKGEGKTWGNSFYLGAVEAIAAAMGKARREARTHATSTALAVVDSRAEKALALKKQLHPGLCSMKGGASNVDPFGYAAGLQAGKGLIPSGGGALGNGMGTKQLGGGK